MALEKSERYSSRWSRCDELRGGMDARGDLDGGNIQFARLGR